jgi:hypothetical protein
MPKKLSKSEAERIIKKFCKPPYDPDEAKLKEAMWVKLKPLSGRSQKKMNKKPPKINLELAL